MTNPLRIKWDCGPFVYLRRYNPCRWVRIAAIRGPWGSLGLHLHVWPPVQSHLDLHIFWWVVTLGPAAIALRELDTTAGLYIDL